MLDSLGLHMDEHDQRIDLLTSSTADSDQWAVASAETLIALHELNQLWGTLDPLVQELGIN